MGEKQALSGMIEVTKAEVETAMLLPGEYKVLDGKYYVRRGMLDGLDLTPLEENPLPLETTTLLDEAVKLLEDANNVMLECGDHCPHSVLNRNRLGSFNVGFRIATFLGKVKDKDKCPKLRKLLK